MKKKDKVWVGPELGGRRPFVRESADGVHEAGMLGTDMPEADSVVELRHVEGPLYELESEIKLTAAGPAQVATPAYRDGWMRVFGGKATVGQA